MSHAQQYRQAIDLLNRGKSAEGRALLEAIHRAVPADAPAALALARVETEERNYDRALALLEPLVRDRDTGPGAALQIVHALSLAGRYREAIGRSAEFERLFPLDRSLALAAGAAHSSLPDHEGAHAVLRRQFDAAPDPEIASVLSSTLVNLGRCADAVAILNDALGRFPGDVACLASLANATNYLSMSREEGFRRHRAMARLVEFGVPVIDPLSYPNPADPDRPLRIAILSFDFRAHSVAYFVEAILRHHDRSRYHITAFSTSAVEDHVTERLRPLADAWRSHLSGVPRMLAREVWADRADVVVELGGLTGGSALAALVPQVAPVQVTAIGYPNTTGFGTIGYRLVDACTDPPGEADGFSTEKLVRLDPCFLCFTPRTARVSARVGAGGVVFGSFNKVAKYSDACVRTWAEILAATPGSRLLLKSPALDAPSAREFLLQRFGAVGAPIDRIDLVGRQEAEQDHLAMYDRIDIALDSFPYNGTTTTCEALQMGVPVVALEGTTHAGRVGLSLLGACGFPELVARSREQYVGIATDLASKADLLRAQRIDRSQKMLSSALCDGPAYAARWQDAIRSMWRTWCEQKRSRSSPSARH